MFIIQTTLSFRIMRSQCLPHAPIFSYVYLAQLTDVCLYQNTSSVCVV